jgi:hypothetical protein
MMRPAGFFICLFLCSICVHAQPVLRWAADPNSNAHYTFYAPGKALAGFEYEIINAVARRLGRRADFLQLPVGAAVAHLRLLFSLLLGTFPYFLIGGLHENLKFLLSS